MQVVEHNHQRRALGGGADEGCVSVEESELCGLRVADALGCFDAVELEQHREDACQLGDLPRVEVFLKLGRGHRARVLVADLNPWPVRRHSLRLVCTPDEYLRPAHAGVGLELHRGAGLAAARLADEHRDVALTRERVVEGRAQPLQFRLPADEDTARESVERVHVHAGVGRAGFLGIDTLEGGDDVGRA